MNRAEFMAALEAQLRDITTEERDEALKFYNEYLDEAGPENEAAVLAELGSPQKVACIIRANCGFGVPAVRDAAEKSTAPEKPEQAPVPELTPSMILSARLTLNTIKFCSAIVPVSRKNVV